MPVNVTPQRHVRIAPELEAEARAKAGLDDVDISTLVRVGLLVLAGYGIAEAIRKAGMKPGPKPR